MLRVVFITAEQCARMIYITCMNIKEMVIKMTTMLDPNMDLELEVLYSQLFSHVQ